jgi:hypothetical protein
MSEVTFRVPNFIDSDGISYSDIEVIVEMNGDIREAAKLADSLQHPVREADNG